MASKSSFFALSGGSNTLLGTTILAGGTYASAGAGVYYVKRAVPNALAFSLPPNANNFTFTVVVYIKDALGDAGTAPITITDPSGYLIDGQSSLVLNTPFASATLVFNGTGWSQVA